MLEQQGALVIHATEPQLVLDDLFFLSDEIPRVTTERIIPETVAALAAFELKSIAAAHCTGWRAVNALAAAFGDAVAPSAVGKTFRYRRRPTMADPSEPKWRHDGVRVVHSNELDINTAQTPGMNRAAAITHARAGAEKLWAGTVVIHPNAKTGAHHHGPVESVIYVVSGRARMRWGERLEFVADAGPGDFIYVPPYVPHQEINASDDEPLSCVLCAAGRSRWW